MRDQHRKLVIRMCPVQHRRGDQDIVAINKGADDVAVYHGNAVVTRETSLEPDFEVCITAFEAERQGSGTKGLGHRGLEAPVLEHGMGIDADDTVTTRQQRLGVARVRAHGPYAHAGLQADIRGHAGELGCKGSAVDGKEAEGVARIVAKLGVCGPQTAAHAPDAELALQGTCQRLGVSKLNVRARRTGGLACARTRRRLATAREHQRRDHPCTRPSPSS